MQLLAGVLGLLLAYSPQGASDPQGRIEGKAVDAISNAPLTKVRLWLSGLPHYPYHLTVETDENGSFVFDKLPSAGFSLLWKKDRYITDLYWDRRPGSMGTLIPLQPGEIKKGLLLSLSKQTQLSGRVVDEEGSPMFGVRVELLPQDPVDENGLRRDVLTAKSNWGGEFVLSNIRAYKFLLRASIVHDWRADAVYLGKVGGLAGFAYLPAFYPGVEHAQQAQTIELEAGETLSSFVFVLPKTKTFWVRGRFSGGAAEASTQVWREAVLKRKCGAVEGRECNASSGKSSSLQAKDGSFAIFGVSPGNYELVIEEQSKSGSKVIGSIELIVSNSDLEELVVPVVEG